MSLIKKKIILFISLIASQSTHAALQLVNQYRHPIACGTLFCGSEFVISQLPRLSNQNALVAVLLLKQAKIRSNFEYLSIAIPYGNQILQTASLFCSHEAVLKGHAKYSRFSNIMNASLVTQFFSQLKSVQDRLTYIGLFSIPSMYCSMESSPLFFNDTHMHWIYRTIKRSLCNYILKTDSLLSGAFSTMQFIDDSIIVPVYGTKFFKPITIEVLKKILEKENKQNLKNKDHKFYENKIDEWLRNPHEANLKLSQLLQSMYTSYTLCRACGFLKTPFPNAYNVLPLRITHYANQSGLGPKATSLFINICQDMAYACFIRLVFYKTMRAINDYGISPIANFCIPKKDESTKSNNKIDLRHYIGLILSGIIMFYFYDQILQLLESKGCIRF